MRHLLRAAAAASLLLALTSLPLHADDDGDEGETLDAVHEAVEKGELKPLPELKAIISKDYPGEIVRIEPHRTSRRITYEFKVLRQDGRLVEIEMDAASGRILEVENE